MHLDIHLRVQLDKPPRVSLRGAASLHFHDSASGKDERILFHPLGLLQALIELRQAIVLLDIVVGWPFDDQVRPWAMNWLAMDRHRIGDVPRVEARPPVAVGASPFSESGL